MDLSDTRPKVNGPTMHFARFFLFSELTSLAVWSNQKLMDPEIQFES
jgi:hypothetical protein